MSPAATPEELQAKLPPGRHGLPAEFVAANQYNRLMEGAIHALVETGDHGMTIANITKAAAVSRRTFYEHFKSKEEIVVAAVRAVLEEFVEAVAAGAEGASDPRRAFIDALLQFADKHPDRTYVVVVEAMAADSASYEAMLNRCAEFANTPPAVIAGILWTLRWRIKGKREVDAQEFRALASVGFADPTKE